MIRIGFFLLVALTSCLTIAASAEEMTISGRLLKPNGDAVISSSVTFKVEILDSTTSHCVLYSETLGSINMANSDGFFEIKVGGGPSSTNYTLKEAMNNSLSFSSISCDVGNTYNPVHNIGRKLRISFDDGSGPHTLDGIDITYVPLAIHSQTTQTIGGFSYQNLLRIEDSGTPGPATPLTTANYSTLKDLINGSSGLYCKASSNGTTVIPTASSDPSSPSAGEMWYQGGAVKYFDGSAVQTLGTAGGGVTAVTAGNGLIGGTITGSGTLNVDTGTTAYKIVQLDSSAKLPAVDGSALTNLPLKWLSSGSNINYPSGNVGIGTNTPIASLHVSRSGSDATLMLETNTLSYYAGATFKQYNTQGYIGFIPAGSGFSIGSISTVPLILNTNNAERMRISATGNIGIGTSAPRATMDVNGVILGKPPVTNATTTIDFNSGNLQSTSQSCGGFQLYNLKDGGTYMLAIQNGTPGTCSFLAFSDAGTTSLTVHMPPDHDITTLGKHTLYNFVVFGSHLYVSWTPGY